MLDTENPRHEPVKSQREAIQALIATERQKLVVLAEDIGENGLSPMDLLLVVQNGKNYAVVEGNRRLCAIKLLNNPSLAEHTPIAPAIKRVADEAAVPTGADCAIMPSREAAKHWMVLRHSGEAGGAGVVRWNTLASNRFSHRPGSQASKAISFLEALRAGYPKNMLIDELSIQIADKRLTTLGRLVSDPNFRSRLGITEEAGSFLFQYPAAALQEPIEHMLADIATHVSVSQLKSKEQRAQYLSTTPAPDPTTRLSEPKALSDTVSVKPSSSRTPKPRSKPPKPPRPLKDLVLNKLGTKTQALLQEFRSLDPEKLPNAAAVLTRGILELSVDEYISKKGLKLSDNKLRKRLAACLRDIDPTNKASEYQALRTGLQDGSSLYAVATLHAFVHNRHYHADGTTVRSIAANIEPFLQALNDRV